MCMTRLLCFVCSLSKSALDRLLTSTSAACKLRRCDGDNNVIGCRSANAHASVAADRQQLALTSTMNGSVYE